MEKFICSCCGTVVKNEKDWCKKCGNTDIFCDTIPNFPETKIIPYKIVAILSTTILPLDGCYDVKTLTSIPNITRIPHYIGHPTTKEIVEKLGAVKAPTNLFKGLEQSGDSALCFSIKQGMSTRKEEGFTSPHQEIDITQLDVRLITRIDWEVF